MGLSKRTSPAFHSATPESQRSMATATVSLSPVPRKRMMKESSVLSSTHTTTFLNSRIILVILLAVFLFSLGMLMGAWFFTGLESTSMHNAPLEAATLMVPSTTQSNSATHLGRLLLGKVYGDKAILPHQLRQSNVEEDNVDGLPPYGGKLNHAVYTVDARSLGPKYTAAFNAYDKYIENSRWDTEATAFAKHGASHPAQAAVLRSSYELPDYVRFHSLLEQRELDVDDDDDSAATMALTKNYYQVQNLDTTGLETNFVTKDQKWEWHYSLFSYQEGVNDEGSIQDIIHKAYFDTPGQSFGQNNFRLYVSGCFWYPPGCFREWHTNYNSARHQNNRNMPWRMYYVRQLPVANDASKKPPQNMYNQTAMHILEGPGLSGEYLKSIGGLPLTSYTDGTPNVWRLPDRDGQVGLFRLQSFDPFRWHTIVSDGEMHRFSLGLGSHSDEEVAMMLQYAGVPL